MLLSLILALAATFAPANPSQPGGPDEQAADARAQAKLDAARERWRAAKISSYRYRLETSCFCAPSSSGKVRFLVRNRRPVKPRRRYRDLATVPRLFDTIQEAIDQEGGTALARYRRNGSPKAFTDDRYIEAIDDELYYSIDRFETVR